MHRFKYGTYILKKIYITVQHNDTSTGVWETNCMFRPCFSYNYLCVMYTNQLQNMQSDRTRW